LPPFGLPKDPAQWLALGLALAALVTARLILGEPAKTPRFLLLWGAAAAALSAAYVVVYLRGGPRIIDATSYLLEARGLAKGLLSFPLDAHAPETATLGRFLVRSDHLDGPHATVIFPPGWPAVLALGVLARAPLAVGPLLAAAIVALTYELARRVAPSGDQSENGALVARLAALLSVVCAALRYHTADTMSHGLAALCWTAALAALLAAADASSDRRASALGGAAGLATGWLLATRPVSSAPLLVVVAFLLAKDPSARARLARIALAMALGALPGVALFAAHQHAATGAWGASSQGLYYAVSDGPPGCFRYGFGRGIGCLGEHGDFVHARLADGYGALAAAGTTLRRLKAHLVDPMNVEPLALLVPLGAFLASGSARGRALGLALAAQVAAYAPFYFDGNYPGGGGRFFCDLLPIEHILVAIAVTRLAATPSAARRASSAEWAALAVALALAGFAFRAGFDHAQLRDRDGGAPFFSDGDRAEARARGGLLFLDSDHGFDLAYDPGPDAAIQVARHHGDALDRMTWEAHGKPPAWLHRFLVPEGGGRASVSVTPLAFPAVAPSPLRIEGESLWPPLAQRDGWALPEWAAGTCASADRWLEVHRATGADEARIDLVLPVGRRSGHARSAVRARVAVGQGASGEVTLGDHRVAFGGPKDAGSASITCLDLTPLELPAEGRVVLTLLVRGDALAALDALDLLRAAE
jgi:hypothetical protein